MEVKCLYLFWISIKELPLPEFFRDDVHELIFGTRVCQISVVQEKGLEGGHCLKRLKDFFGVNLKRCMMLNKLREELDESLVKCEGVR